MLYGVSYYLEYQPYDRLEADVEMMQAANINFARVGDSIWALCEPEEGTFALDWFARVLDALHQARTQVVLATPTYAIPAWLWRRYPEVMATGPDGRPAPFGDRQNTDLTHPTYRRLAERIIRALLDRYGQHPAVIGVQVDNETGGRTLYNESVFDAFVDRLRTRFETVDRVNEIWGLNYWSHRISDWSQLWRPSAPHQGVGGNTNPGYDLEWRRFRADLVTEFLTWQTGIVREYLRPDQFITHDVVGGHGLPHSDRHAIAQAVDIPAENFPFQAQDGLNHPPVPGAPTYHDPSGVHGAAQIYFRGDLARSGGKKNYLVTETNSISMGGSAHHFPAYPGQWRLAAYAAASRGANAMAYWHWHTLHYGSESYSGGVLGHDLAPNRFLDEVTQIGAEVRALGPSLTDLTAAEDVAMLYSPDSRYALSFQPCLTVPGTSEGDRRSYERTFDTFYRAFFDARAQIGIRQDLTALADYPVVVAPALYIADDETLTALADYAHRGGHLVLSFRSGYADEYARARWDRTLGPLRPAVGAGYSLYSTVQTPVPLVAADGAPGERLSIGDDARAEGWLDELEPEGATPLAYYEHQFFGRFPAVTHHRYGAGEVTYVGTLPNASLGRSIADWVLDRAGVHALGAGLPEPVRVTRAEEPTGERLWFVTNWSSTGQQVPAPVSGIDRLTGERLGAGAEIDLPLWGVSIVAE